MINFEPLVSVGVPTFNRPNGLKKTLDCITKQTYSKLEIIVSDNCSSDSEVGNIIKTFMEADSRIIYYKQIENIGPYKNFNFVLGKASGEYFMWAADDDWWDSLFIESNVRLIQSNQECIASFSNFIEVDQDGKRIKSYPEHLSYLLNISQQDTYKRIYNFISQHEKYGKANLLYSVIKLNILKELNFNFREGITGLDDLFVLSWLSKGNIAIVNNVLYKCTVGNTKYYSSVDKIIIVNLFLVKINVSIIRYTINGWCKYFILHFPIINSCGLDYIFKIQLYLLVCKRLILTLYDAIIFSLDTPIFNIFKYFRRKNPLVNFTKIIT